MRIAICLSGLTRTYKSTYDNFRNALLVPNAHHEVDVFIHSWTRGDSGHSGEQIRGRPIADYEVDQADLAAHYSPTKMVIEYPFVIDGSRFDGYREDGVTPRCRPGTSIGAVMCMLYKIHACDRLRRQHEIEHGFQYDIVIRTRFDSLYPLPLQVDQFERQFLYLPVMPQGQHCDYSSAQWHNDKFALGNADNIRIYSDLYLELDKIVNSGAMFQPEILTFEQLNRNGVLVKLLGYDLHFCRNYDPDTPY